MYFFLFRIDLTQICNQNILVAPPPIQFSDDYPNNECKLLFKLVFNNNKIKKKTCFK